MPKFATEAVHAGQDPDPHTGAVIPPISLSTTFAQSAPAQHKGFEYSRSLNPNRAAFEQAVSVLEKADYGLAFASGSATTASIVNMFPKGTHIVSVNDVYGGTYRYFTKVATKMGMEVDFVDLLDPENLKTVLKSNTKLVWIETPTNPTLRLVDIQKVAQLTKAHGSDVLLVVDNTFMSPYFQNPIELGADIVVHSVTKYINGHSDCVMGIALLKNKDLYERLKFLQNSIGAVPSAFDCFLAHRGLKTLHLRMQQHEKNAIKVAEYLESLVGKSVEKVFYPGLKSHAQHELAKRQQKGFGGMISFRLLKTGIETSSKFLQNLKYFTLAESLGGVESLAELPCVMTHGSVSAEDRQKLGITDSLIRLSVGIEDHEDLIQDLQNAFKSIS